MNNSVGSSVLYIPTSIKYEYNITIKSTVYDFFQGYVTGWIGYQSSCICYAISWNQKQRLCMPEMMTVQYIVKYR